MTMWKFDDDSSIAELSAEIYRLKELFFHKLTSELNTTETKWGDSSIGLKKAMQHIHNMPSALTAAYIEDRYEGNEGHLLYRWLLVEPRGMIIEHLKHNIEHDLFYSAQVRDGAIDWLGKQQKLEKGRQ